MGAPGRCVDDGDGDAVGEVVGGEASGGHDPGHVLGELLGGERDDEAGLAGAGVADHDDADAGLARQIRGGRRGRRTRHAARLPLSPSPSLSAPRLRVLGDLGAGAAASVSGWGPEGGLVLFLLGDAAVASAWRGRKGKREKNEKATDGWVGCYGFFRLQRRCLYGLLFYGGWVGLYSRIQPRTDPAVSGHSPRELCAVFSYFSSLVSRSED